ncbi:MAG: acetylornithine transaminase [Deltaproteobacteria bacterium]|nr:acetylornithine transaminase [Deltaproteobacteria bacterium]
MRGVMQRVEPALMNTYSPFPVTFVRGSGCELYDAKGRRYLDCLGGIAVVSAGHANPEIAAAITDQANKLMHVSNIFLSEPMLSLAQRLRRSAGEWGQVFFCNSGAEANECAIKLVRKHGNPGRYKIVCAFNGFHGRTLATLAATGQPTKWQGFEPLPNGFVHVPFNDLAAFEEAVDAETVAVMVEPVQGEGGVVPATKDFLKGLRDLCDIRGLALIFDEVQSGMGRSGSWWAFQEYGVRPDIFTVAKGLANGLPIGACLAAEQWSQSFKPGDHGSTFGGGLMASRAALATLDFLESNGCLKNARERGAELSQALAGLPHLKEVRGLGLMIGAVLDQPRAKEVVKGVLEQGLVVNATSENVIRFLPPLVITSEQVQEAAAILGEFLKDHIR